jgi:tetratricopeptide (TPR) repeat protein
MDPVEYGALWEQHLLDGDRRFQQIVKLNPFIHIELALDYAHAGIYTEATRLLQAVSQDTLAAYTLGWVYVNQGDYESALETYQYAASLSKDYCFPNRLEDILILESAQQINPDDANAPYYLGNFWYAHRCHEEAIRCWEKSANLSVSFPTVHRNLGLAYFNKRQDPKRALECFELAFRLDKTYARVLFEIAQLYKRVNRGPQERLEKLMEHIDLVDQRDDLTIELVTILNMLGRHDEAYQVLMKRVFHPWEGGEGKVTAQYITCLVEEARTLIARGEAQAAVECLEQAQVYPPNLGEGKLYGARENNIFYTLGCAYEELGLQEQAITEFPVSYTHLTLPTTPYV